MVLELPRSAWDGELSPAANNLRDEQLLRSGEPMLRVAVFDAPSLSLGVNQPDSHPTAVRARKLGLPVVRRGSGGTGILHLPGDLAWALVLPRSDPTVGADFVRAYDRLGAGCVRFLAGHRLPSQWTEAPSLSEVFCLLGSRGKVLTVRDQVIGGAAQHLTRRALLHHGVVMYRPSRSLLTELFDLDPRTVDTRLTGLVDELGHRSPAELGRSLLSAMIEQFSGTPPLPPGAP